MGEKKLRREDYELTVGLRFFHGKENSIRVVYQSAIITIMLDKNPPPNTAAYNNKHLLLALTSAGWLMLN